MINLVEKHGYTDLQKMVFSVHSDLVVSGFRLLFYRNTNSVTLTGMTIDPQSLHGLPDYTKVGLYVFQTTPAVDTFSVDEPYNLVFFVHPTWWKVFVCTPKGLLFNEANGNFSVEAYTEDYWPEDDSPGDKFVGSLTLDGLSSDTGLGHQFLSLSPTSTTWLSIKTIPILSNGSIDLNSSPLSYILNVSSHGFALCTWIENNNKGDCQAWLCIQRPKSNKGLISKSSGKHPVWCLYSLNGGGDIKNSNLYNLEANGIRQFVVRERDIDLPSIGCSAVSLGGIHSPIINPLEQLSIRENYGYSITIPTGMNTWRYCYTDLLDLIAYASADISSFGKPITQDIFDSGSPITYKALLSNKPNNRGMRLFIQTDGPEEDNSVSLSIRANLITRTVQREANQPVIFIELDLIESKSGSLYYSQEDLIIHYTLGPQTTAQMGIDYIIQNEEGFVIIPKGHTRGKLFGQALLLQGENIDKEIHFSIEDTLSNATITTVVHIAGAL
jgi:hypothetical protein